MFHFGFTTDYTQINTELLIRYIDEINYQSVLIRVICGDPQTE